MLLYSVIFYINHTHNLIPDKISNNTFTNYDLWIRLYDINNYDILTNIINTYIFKYKPDLNIIVFNKSIYDLSRMNIVKNSNEYNIIINLIHKKESILSADIGDIIMLLSKLTHDHNHFNSTLDLYDLLKSNIKI
jgi:hypothetical protein